MQFASCEHCHVHLTPGHIVQSVAIPNSPSYMAVILKCPMCRENTKLVVKRELLEAALVQYETLVEQFDEILSEAHGEIMDVESVAHLQEMWSKIPPRMEATRGLCKCKDCKEKWYVS
jgi:hypothetical protein